MNKTPAKADIILFPFDLPQSDSFVVRTEVRKMKAYASPYYEPFL
ncbi:hypothetical protein QT995_12655 [Microcoleus sp. S36b_A3]